MRRFPALPSGGDVDTTGAGDAFLAALLAARVALRVTSFWVVFMLMKVKQKGRARPCEPATGSLRRWIISAWQGALSPGATRPD
jgi:sugar/nucleoside kinase (ribokinase family)